MLSLSSCHGCFEKSDNVGQPKKPQPVHDLTKVSAQSGYLSLVSAKPATSLPLIAETKSFHFTYYGHSLTQADLSQIAVAQEKRFSSMTKRLSALFPEINRLLVIPIHLYESAEEKGLRTRNTNLSHINGKLREVHAIYNDTLNGLDFFAEARLILSELVAPGESSALRDGFAMIFTVDWARQGYKHWTKRINAIDNIIPLAELLNNDAYAKESYLFMRPLAASFVDFLISKVGAPQFIALYKEWPKQGLPGARVAGLDMNELEKAWRSYLTAMPGDVPDTGKQNRKPVFQKGFSYAHEGYRIYNGYLSNKGFEALSRLGSLGAEWISITPFGYLNHRNKPGYLKFSFGAGSENDESVVTALQQARSLGMNGMLKPHVLMNSRNFGWPGEIEMKNERDWQAFFLYYNKWILHYALLAAIYDFDILCIGTELMQTTREHQAEWRQIIQNVRALYHGQITYAANWWQEFEQIQFWDKLDYIGMNCYYPLSDQESVRLKDLKQGVQRIIPLFENAAKKYRKPVLLTELGFISARRSWLQPHKDGRGEKPYMADQALCYQAMFEAIWDKPWFAGFYWWKWPTYLERGGTGHSSFTPNGKPAENIVRHWYHKTRKMADNPIFF